MNQPTARLREWEPHINVLRRGLYNGLTTVVWIVFDRETSVTRVVVHYGVGDNYVVRYVLYTTSLCSLPAYIRLLTLNSPCEGNEPFDITIHKIASLSVSQLTRVYTK